MASPRGIILPQCAELEIGYACPCNFIYRLTLDIMLECQLTVFIVDNTQTTPSFIPSCLNPIACISLHFSIVLYDEV